MSGPLCELPGTPYLPWVILCYLSPRPTNLFLCLIPTLTGDTLRAGVSQPWVFNI